MTALLEAQGVERRYRMRGGRGVVRAVDGVSFSVAAGETVGLVGESGCGKSTIARLLLGLEPLDGGQIRFDGASVSSEDRSRMEAVRRDLQIVFQDPYSALNPRSTVHGTLAEVLLVRGVSDRADRNRRVDELLGLVGLSPEFGPRRPRQLSGGQRQRVVIARALAMEPRMIVADEAVSALDVSVQAQVLNLFARLQDELGLTYLFISHDLDVVRHLCSRVLVMYLGRIVEEGTVEQVLSDPQHPYTRALLESLPSLDPEVRLGRVRAIAGELPNPIDPPTGCHFHPRCPVVMDRCRVEMPPLVAAAEGAAACFRAGSPEADSVP